ncbi:MAG: SDR family oxidoreductase [bacterium]|nr:SDR family oxidoreductase [bacterium]
MGSSSIFRSGLLDGSHVFVTGGGTGIGFGCARELGLLGARITIAARRQQVLEEACGELAGQGIDAAFQVLNIRDDSACQEVLRTTIRERGLPDHLVNNAGGQFSARAQDISANGFRAVMDLNVQGTWHMSSAFARAHRASGTPGRIVNIVFAHTRAMEHFAHGAAARAAVVNLTRTLALEWSDHRILVNAVGPGAVMTEGMRQYDAFDSGETASRAFPVPRLGTPDDIAWMVAYLLSPAGDWITGSIFTIDGGASLGRRER